MKTFILHYTPLVERKEHMNKLIEKHNLDASYILNFDKEDMTDYDKEIYDFKSIWQNRTLYLSNASLISKHIESYKRIVDENLEYGLILEDDVVLNDDFSEKIEDYYKQLPEDWDILFVGDGYRGGLHVPKKVMEELGGNVFLKSNNGTSLKLREQTGWPVCAGSTRCSDTYLINRKTATNILNYVNKIRETKKNKINQPSDLWMNRLFKSLMLKVYWGEPTISTQGTENGLFKSAHGK